MRFLFCDRKALYSWFVRFFCAWRAGPIFFRSVFGLAMVVEGYAVPRSLSVIACIVLGIVSLIFCFMAAPPNGRIKRSCSMKKIAVAVACTIILAVGMRAAETAAAGKRILIIPAGTIDRGILSDIRSSLETAFGRDAETGEEIRPRPTV